MRLCQSIVAFVINNLSVILPVIMRGSFTIPHIIYLLDILYRNTSSRIED